MIPARSPWPIYLARHGAVLPPGAPKPVEHGPADDADPVRARATRRDVRALAAPHLDCQADDPCLKVESVPHATPYEARPHWLATLLDEPECDLDHPAGKSKGFGW